MTPSPNTTCTRWIGAWISCKDIRDAGIKVEMCEGGVIQNLIFSNLVMKNVPRPVVVTLSRQRACDDMRQSLFAAVDPDPEKS